MKDSIEKLPWNPLIKELTCQALAMCDDSKMTPLSSSVDDGRADIPLEFSEKFAELIVRECIRKYQELDDAVVVYSLREGKEVTKEQLILRHFGFEE